MKRFRIGGIQECMLYAILITITYLFIAVQFGLPLIRSDISEVFATLCLGIPLSFIFLISLEIFIFERDLFFKKNKIIGEGK